MLQQISWYTYAVSIILLLTLYYLYIGLTYYRTEILALVHKFSGKQPALKTAGNSDLHIPEDDIMGKAEPEAIDFVAQEELHFGPPEEPDDQMPDKLPYNESSSALIVSFSEMVSEAKTLIRVINESSESKENFEMLFRLIVQKYPVLRDTPYQQQIIDFMMEEGAPEFPFPLTEKELTHYWTQEN